MGFFTIKSSSKHSSKSSLRQVFPLVLSGLVVLLGLLLAACGDATTTSAPATSSATTAASTTSAAGTAATTAATGTGKTAVTLALSYIPDVQFAPYYVAQD